MTRAALFGTAAAALAVVGLAVGVLAAQRPSRRDPPARAPEAQVRISVVAAPPTKPVLGPKLETLPPGTEDVPVRTGPPAPRHEPPDDSRAYGEAAESAAPDPYPAPDDRFVEAEQDEAPAYADARPRWRERGEEAQSERPIYRDDRDRFGYSEDPEPPPPPRWWGR